MTKPLMVLEESWHYRKATNADLPQCMTCKFHLNGICDNRKSFTYALWTYSNDGCNNHEPTEQAP